MKAVGRKLCRGDHCMADRCTGKNRIAWGLSLFFLLASPLLAEESGRDKSLSSSFILTADSSWDEEPVLKESSSLDPSPQAADSSPLPSPLSSETKAHVQPVASVQGKVDIAHAIASSPYIYGALLLLSMTALFLSLYNSIRLLELQKQRRFFAGLREKMERGQWAEASLYCRENSSLLGDLGAALLQPDLLSRAEFTLSLESRIKSFTLSTWQRIGILNDIVVLSPMIGLLGTVLGMFYAFYNTNRSMESVAALFDGLGISVGTTLAGIAVAIFALILQIYSKQSLIRTLGLVEEEAKSLYCAAEISQGHSLWP